VGEQLLAAELVPSSSDERLDLRLGALVKLPRLSL
jgi:hypothetical protein